ncbi:protein EXPORTIN 1A isoform X1 [Canna indica]|uniref:Protein EXPORTIN 1A isoform X1 n=1 Tax=Canna indica TaxID=4628 RepID=A0AAQ3Q2E1_9LILI|nr:protein EXPORTIN 1A isoform X1 [Canna indica]
MKGECVPAVSEQRVAIREWTKEEDALEIRLFVGFGAISEQRSRAGDLRAIMPEEMPPKETRRFNPPPAKGPDVGGLSPEEKRLRRGVSSEEKGLTRVAALQFGDFYDMQYVMMYSNFMSQLLEKKKKK